MEQHLHPIDPPENGEEYYVIIKTENDVIVETFKNAFAFLAKLLKERKQTANEIEFISKQEFNDRLDEMMLVY